MKQEDKTKLGRMWPVFLIGLLVTGAGSNLFMVFLAVSDPSFSVEDQYHKKAINWDKEMAQQEQNKKLGWSIQFQTQPSTIATQAGKMNTLVLHVQVLDQQKKPLPKVEIKLVSFHNARASKLYKRTFKQDKKGSFVSSIPFKRWGAWEFRFEVLQGKKRFTQKIQRFIKSPKTKDS